MKLVDRRLLELLDRRSLGEFSLSGKRLLVGLSGGADSVALLRALVLFCDQRDVKLAAVHVNHGIRRESYDEEQFVKSLCKTIGIELSVHNLKLGKKPQKTSPEQYWREKRYEAFALSMEESNADYLALGHTADDLAETFLYHLVRGTSPDGLAFYFYRRSGLAQLPILRPLWKTRRSHIEQALINIDQEWINDPSNADLRYSRNRIRQEVIPALEKINPAAVTALVNFADKLSAYIEEDATSINPGSLRLDLNNELRALPYVEVCRAVHQFLDSNGKLSHSTRHVEQAAEMGLNYSSGVVALPDSQTLVVTQSYAWLYDGAEPTDLELAREHCRRFSELAADLSEQSIALDARREIIALDGQCYEISIVFKGHAQIRNRRAGDRVGPKSLKKLLIDYKIPWYLRDYLILAATDAGQVVDLVTECGELRDWVARHSTNPCKLTCAKILPSA